MAVVIEASKGNMRPAVIASLCLLLCACAGKDPMNDYKKDVTIWYDAFNTKDARLVDRILSEDWVDIPAAPGQPPGREGMKHLIVQLTTSFPDLKVTNEEILQEGNKVIVRSQLTGTQRGNFVGLAPKNRALNIMAIDIHEFRDGKIVRTWHTEDWLTGLHQLGAFEK
jgi:steroid delta-isomerase-like uncharacterized protein